MRLIWIVVAVGVVLVPLFVSPAGKDPFRLPKEILLRVDAMFAVALAFSWPWQSRTAPRGLDRAVLALVALILGWTAVTTVASTHLLLSLDSLTRVATLGALFLATYALADRQPLAAALLPIAPAVINGGYYILESARRDALFRIAMSMDDRPPALLGNPHDVANFLVAPAVAAAAWATATRRARLPMLIVAALLTFAVFATQTLTAAIALVAGLATLAVIRWRRRSIAALVALAILFAAAIALYQPLTTRARLVKEAAREGALDEMLSGRLVAFRAAWLMFRDHPVFGVGPGAYGVQYYPYKMAAARENPALLESPAYSLNFGEAHNDYLQVLAVTGAPGLALFLAGLILVGRISIGRRGDAGIADDRSRFARTLALPLAVAVAVMAAASFPLELGPTIWSQLFFAALALRWGR